MALIGYARVSTAEQDTALQTDALNKAGCERIFEDTVSGSKTERPGLTASLEYLRDGDVLVVWRLDRLGRSLPHLIEIISALESRCVGFRSLTESIDTTMKRMGIEALYRKPGTSKKHPGHEIYPYLLRGMKICQSNWVWALDTTYIPMAKGFAYLTAVVDWASRKVLAAKVAITLEACHAVEVLEEVARRYGVPDIVNTDQGSQFTAYEFVRAVKGMGSRLSMDGRGAWRDNVFVERLWKSVKYERVYLHAYETVSAARLSIMEYLNWYNRDRTHSSLGRQTPNEAYNAMLPAVKQVA